MHETLVKSWVWKIPWRRKWQSTPVVLPGESHGQRSLADYSPWGCKESDMTEPLTAIICSQFYRVRLFQAVRTKSEGKQKSGSIPRKLPQELTSDFLLRSNTYPEYPYYNLKGILTACRSHHLVCLGLCAAQTISAATPNTLVCTLYQVPRDARCVQEATLPSKTLRSSI